jgi:hypothetical protein
MCVQCVYFFTSCPVFQLDVVLVRLIFFPDICYLTSFFLLNVVVPSHLFLSRILKNLSQTNPHWPIHMYNVHVHITLTVITHTNTLCRWHCQCRNKVPSLPAVFDHFLRSSHDYTSFQADTRPKLPGTQLSCWYIAFWLVHRTHRGQNSYTKHCPSETNTLNTFFTHLM